MTQIEEPIKRLCKALLEDSELCEAMVAVAFLTNGDARVHGAGLVSTQPELAIFGAARLLHSLLGDYKTASVGGITIEINEMEKVAINATGQANEDPRATLFLLSLALVEQAKVIHDADNLVSETPA